MPAFDPTALPSAYDHTAAQEKWYAFWLEKRYFHAADGSSGDGGDKPPFSIVIPPPNVTGALHLGHALNNTLQDILCRWKRMQGFNVLWMPGTDHAGIATQAVVERRLLEEEGKSRHDLATEDKTAREALVERIWQWKEQYEARITGQLKQLGCSCDWERQRFTLDDQCAQAVRETFFKLFADGKIYRGKRLVNWDTFLQTAVSDDEVFHEEVKGHFWHFHYPVIDPKPGEPESVSIATTRPETMLGDTAVAVHPDPEKQLDKVEAELKEKLAAAPAKEKPPIEAQLEAVSDRRQSILPRLIQLRDMAARGVKLKLPLTDREIPLIADEWAKPELGSGCVKITPAHDPNDYEVWQRNLDAWRRLAIANPELSPPLCTEKLEINILNSDGTLNGCVPEKYRGLTMPKARAAVVEDLAACGAHDPEQDVEDRVIDLAHSDRSKTPIEPYLADQWFVKMDELAQSAMDAVTDGRVKITPERYGKGYLDWLGEKRDWPVGRQLWWGHRIPVWRLNTERLAEMEGDKARNTIALVRNAATDLSRSGRVAVDEDPKSLSPLLCCIRSDSDVEAVNAIETCGLFSQDDEVLDTWFSSALWPFSTMGWPDNTQLQETFYPTSVLVTSRDIITLWVARMVLMGLYNKGEVPFPQVYIHPKILDGYGETMSKSKGNGVDPLDVIEKFGADALRFGIAYLTTETQDVRMPVEFVCPHCEEHIKQTKKNRVLPRVKCDKCGKEFRTQWAAEPADLELPRGAVTSERFELGRNFANKLWNASRFSLTNLVGYEASVGAVSDSEAPQQGFAIGDASHNANGSHIGDLKIEDRWLLSRLATVTQQVTSDLEAFKFAEAARTLYDFAWNEFCSFYLEMTKARFAVGAVSDSEAGQQGIAIGDGSHNGSHNSDKQVAQRVLAHSLDTLLRLLHPMMPFLTEEVWQLLAQVAPSRGRESPVKPAESICIAPWPAAIESDIDTQIEEQFAKFQTVLGAVREARQAQNVPFKEPLEFAVKCDAVSAELLGPMQPYFNQMANATLTTAGPAEEGPDMAASKSVPGMEVMVDVSQFIDVEAERARLEKERDTKTKFVKSMQGKLANKGFVDNAPAEVVEQQRAKLEETKAQLAAIEKALEKLKSTN